MFKQQEYRWAKELKRYKKIMVFGAKSNAVQTLERVKNMGKDIVCFVVSRRADNPFCLENKPVKVFDEVTEEEKRESLVVISQNYEKNEEMKEILLQAGFFNIIASPIQVTNILTDELWQYCTGLLGSMLTVDNFLAGRKEQVSQPLKVCIYAVTSSGNLHEANKVYQSRYIKYLQAGAALTESRICSLADDTGDNISKLNPYFCELTAGYWICKNDRTNEYVGLYHYSRGLAMTDTQVEGLIQAGIDVVLPLPYVFRYKRNEEETAARVEDSSFCLIANAVLGTFPEYADDVEKYFSNNIFFAGNIVFAKKQIFCRYYEWMFQIIYECRRSIGDEYPRIWGFIAEALTNIFFLHHMDDYSILYAPMESLY